MRYMEWVNFYGVLGPFSILNYIIILFNSPMFGIAADIYRSILIVSLLHAMSSCRQCACGYDFPVGLLYAHRVPYW